MRIGIDARFWSKTGVGRYTRSLVRELQEIDKKNEYVLFALSEDIENLKSQISNIKYQIVEADIRWHSISEQLEFPRILSKYNLDLVHFPYFSVPIFYKKPYIVTIHDLILHHFPTGEASTLPLPLYKLKLLGYRFVIKKAAQNAKKIIAVSNATKEEIVDHLTLPEEKISVIYEGVDEVISSKSKNAKYKIPNTKYFLYVGNAYPHKNLERLLEAFNILISQYPNISLVLVGKEDYFYKRLRVKVQEMGISSSVIFKNNVSDKELVGLYQNAIALVQPSLMEGFGLPPLEAMSNGCLVLASDIPALREICGDAAVYFSPTKTDDIAEKMRAVSFDYSNNRKSAIRKGVEKAGEFSWKKMAEETLQVYNNSRISRMDIE